MTDALDEVPVDVHADRLTCPDGLEMALEDRCDVTTASSGADIAL